VGSSVAGTIGPAVRWCDRHPRPGCLHQRRTRSDRRARGDRLFLLRRSRTGETQTRLRDSQFTDDATSTIVVRSETRGSRGQILKKKKGVASAEPETTGEPVAGTQQPRIEARRDIGDLRIPDNPLLPFQQLMTVLPEKSSNLLPTPISKLMSAESETLGEFFPEDFKIDLAGKKREWEGIALLPQVDTEKFLSELDSVLPEIDSRILKRNTVGKTFRYKYSSKKLWTFKSYYGDIIENFCRREFLN